MKASKGSRERLRFLFVVGFLLSSASAYPASDNCLSPELIDSPDLTKLDPTFNTYVAPIGNVPTRQIRYEFKFDEKVTPRELILNEISEPVSWIKSKIVAEIMANETCNASLHVPPFDLYPRPDGSLFAHVDINVTIRACAVFDWICSKGFKFYHCQQRIITDIDKTTFTLDVPIVAAIEADGQTISITPHPQFDDRGYLSNPFRNLIINIVGISTLNIGSKFILDFYRGKLGEITSALGSISPQGIMAPSHKRIAQRLPNGGIKKIVEGFVLNPTETRFVVSSAGTSPERNYPALLVTYDTIKIKHDTFCKFARPYFAQLGAYFRSTNVGDVEKILNTHDNLWSAAKSAYGDGTYFVALLKQNDIAFAQKNDLQVGQKIVIPAMYKLWKSSDYLVKNGDSLWGISRSFAESASQAEIYKQNRKFIDKPDRIYPAQLFGVSQ
ncbi:hypothetical protein Msil_2097 [Methylocella silvestris BL2]|uniref:LysM domain-containing protein n=1 Tax=Methylocella silvestris (strain DSM 15510 / CIP 108128 / LMG 27833 / NCIMB 13906 / BL2) TaxID=395965 RepID=B8ERI4_METSB|nr:LysM peptidoglycan-binding domain-containing protein [Methylocella silvestris]ACK51036.1 hypothetical protein Msil_2097 [Methylocella silvestris BL2]